MTYKEEVTLAMETLAKNERVIFIGQGLLYPGHVMYSSLEGIPKEKKIELPVIEDTQMGMSIGLALKGYIPISIYPRMDFLILAMNQLVNHLDKIALMTNDEFQPRVIIRTMVGSKVPLNGGYQHTQDHTEGLRRMLKTVRIVQVMGNPVCNYQIAFNDAKHSYIMVEYGNLYK